MENKENISRNQMHEKLMICVYQYLFYLSISEKQDLNTIIRSAFGNDEAKNDPFVVQNVKSFITNLPEIVSLIEPKLKETWTFERLGLMERSILVLGVNEIKYFDVPKPIVINTCVKLAKKYCDDNQYKFINAILEKI